jgi:hypothetical protein
LDIHQNNNDDENKIIQLLELDDNNNEMEQLQHNTTTNETYLTVPTNHISSQSRSKLTTEMKHLQGCFNPAAITLYHKLRNKTHLPAQD